MRPILRNSIQTPDGTILTSRHVHDYCQYQDKNGEIYMVDGGLSYIRRSVNTIPYTDLTVWDNALHNTRREVLVWGVNYTKEGKRLPETEYRKIKDMDTDHIYKVLELFSGSLPKIYLDVFTDEIIKREEGGGGKKNKNNETNNT